MAQHAMADVAEIGGALAQVAVGDREHLRTEFIDHPKERTLGGIAGVDRLANAADELLVFENLTVAVENLEFGRRHQRLHPNLERRQFAQRARQRLLEPPGFGLGVGRAQVSID